MCLEYTVSMFAFSMYRISVSVMKHHCMQSSVIVERGQLIDVLLMLQWSDDILVSILKGIHSRSVSSPRRAEADDHIISADDCA